MSVGAKQDGGKQTEARREEAHQELGLVLGPGKLARLLVLQLLLRQRHAALEDGRGVRLEVDAQAGDDGGERLKQLQLLPVVAQRLPLGQQLRQEERQDGRLGERGVDAGGERQERVVCVPHVLAVVLRAKQGWLARAMGPAASCG